jgi:hypothetical protein
VKLFLIAMKTPGLRDFLVSPKGIVGAMQFGVANKALIQAGSGLGLRGLAKIARELPGYPTSNSTPWRARGSKPKRRAPVAPKNSPLGIGSEQHRGLQDQASHAVR